MSEYAEDTMRLRRQVAAMQSLTSTQYERIQQLQHEVGATSPGACRSVTCATWAPRGTTSTSFVICSTSPPDQPCALRLAIRPCSASSR